MEFYAPNDPQNMSQAILVFFHTVTLFDLTLTLSCAWHEPFIRHDRHSFSSTLAESGLTYVFGLVSVVDMAKRVNCDL